MTSPLDLNWHFDPGIVAGLIVAAGWYGLGAVRLISRSGMRAAPRLLAFMVGLLVVAVALLSPLDSLSDQLFSAHMAQHVLLMDVAAPLILLGHPLTGFLMGMNTPIRHAIGQGWARRKKLQRTWAWFNQPLAAWLLYAGVLWIWHIPALYSLALEALPIHAMEHLSYLTASMLFWWVVLDRFYQLRHASLVSGILFLLSFGLQSGLLGALLAASTQPWYPVYAGLSLTNFTLLADQQLAGLIMMATDGLLYPVAALLLLKARTASGKPSS